MDITTISAIAGLVSTGVTIIGIIIGGFYLGKSTATKTASDAQEKAINAMQVQMQVQNTRIDQLLKDNSRLQQTIETICSALKIKGMIISIQGEMVSIEDAKGSTTTTKIPSEK